MCAVRLLRVSVHERLGAAAEDVLLRVEKGEEAAEIPALRALLTERLTAAAEEIVGLFEETVAEYEDRAERSEREIQSQRRLLDAVLKPEVKLHRADVQQLLVVQEEVPPEQQEWNSSLDQEDPEPPHIKEDQEDPEPPHIKEDQEDPEPPHIKEEQEDPEPPHIKEEQKELWTSQEGEQLQGLEEADITKFSFTPVKSEDDEEEAQSSQLHQRQIEQMETEADGEDCGGPEPDRNSDPDRHPEPDSDEETGDFSVAEIEVSCEDFEETREPQSGLNPELPVCGKKYRKQGSLVQRAETRQSCRVCNKRPEFDSGIERRCCDSSECDKRCCYSRRLSKETLAEDRELFGCSVCGRRFTQRGYLTQHMMRHTGKIRFRCCVCGRRFAWRHELKNHQCDESSPSHTAADGGSDSEEETSDSDEDDDDEGQSGSNTNEEVGDSKSFVCSECGKTFSGEETLKSHTRTHSGEKLFGCSFCKKGLTQRGHVTDRSVTEDKRFLYCVCGKRFAWRYDLKQREACSSESSDLKVQSRVGPDGPNETAVSLKNDVGRDLAERPFGCSRCEKRFRRKKNLQEHMRIHTGEKPYGCSVCMKYFSCSGSLRKHLRIHTGEKPFSCSVCGNRFTESGHLKVHMRTHTGEKPFSCSVCGKSFTWRQSFNNHMKYHKDSS